MATRLVGALGPFDQGTRQWSSYAERMEEYLLANGVTEERKKVAILLSTIGSQTYDLLKDLYTPDKPNTKSFEEIVTKLTEHLEPKPTVIAERYRLHQRQQKVGESVITYMAALRRLAKDCNYGAFFEEALRDKFVCGLANEGIKMKLLQEKDLTLAKACEIATAMEAAEKDTSTMHNNKGEVHRIGGKKISRAPRTEQAKPVERCYRCKKGGHHPAECKFKTVKCFHCGKEGHIADACRNMMKREQPRSKIKQIREDSEDSDGESVLNGLQEKSSQQKAIINVKINKTEVPMEIDTGAAVTIVPRSICSVKLEPSTRKLRSATGQLMKLAGQTTVKVQIGKTIKLLTLYVAKEKCPLLFGRDWIQAFFGENWMRRLTNQVVHSVEEVSTKLDKVLQKYTNTVFRAGLGKLKSITAHLRVKPNTQEKFYKPRAVPFAVKPKLEKALDAMMEEGNLEKVDFSKWDTPIVPVIKPDGTVRVCGDYKVTLNPCLEVQQYPLPRVEECFQAMNGGNKFTKIDLAQAYNQIMLDDESKSLTTINTHKGLYQWTRLPYGVASSPAIFQGIMDKILQGLHQVVWYLDDILITGETEEQHLANVEEVLSRLEKYGLRARRSKCQFLQDSVQYLGHVIDKEGIHPVEKKVEAILAPKPPKNIEQLQSFMGMVNYYGKFIPNLSTIAAPLNELRKKEVKWKWTKREEKVFEQLKQQIASAKVLVHYDPKLPLKLDCDASSVGIGAVLLHVMKDATERPIAYASRSLSKAERNYSQIEREALSIVWGISKFHTYLYLNKFTLVTDHKPLTVLFNPDKAIPVLASGRIQRWALFLMDYRYHIQFRSTTKHGNADTLSRFPLEYITQKATDIVASVQQQQFEEIQVSTKQIAESIRKNPLLAKILSCVKMGWPEEISAEQQPYYQHREELTIEENCLLKGMQVVIPPDLREKVLNLLHETHPGIVRMKALARSYVWWPSINKDLKDVAHECEDCQQNHKEDQRTPLHPLAQPNKPWQRVHLDYAGPFIGQMWLIVVDAFSKWPEVIPMSTTTAKHTIQELRLIFARFGLPEIVIDNGPQFVSKDFEDFTSQNGIRHSKVAPYHPRSNGLAERFVQTFKMAMKKMSRGGGDINQKLTNFLLNYRKSPQSTVKEAPAMLLMKRIPRSRLDLLVPSLNKKIIERQVKQKKRPKG